MNFLGRVAQRIGRAVRRGLGPIIRIWEDRHFRDAGNELASHLQPVFIIGAPRTGSTILYQALTNAFDVIYIDNTAARWFRNLRFGMWLSRQLYGVSPHNNFRAAHGDTSLFGGHAPSECGEFWYRWLPRSRHFIDDSDITPEMVEGIRKEIAGATLEHDRPFVFKNLNAGQRLRLIKRAFPGARLIFIRRDPRFVVRSILQARARLGYPPYKWWSVMPANVVELLSLPEPEMCAAQVFYLERQIVEDIKLFPPEQVFEVHYQNLDATLLGDLANKLGLVARAGGSLPEFSRDALEKLDAHERSELDQLVGHYQFDRELFI